MSPKAATSSTLIREPIVMPEPEHDVARALKEVLRALGTVMKGRMRSRGEALSFAQTMLLVFLAREPGSSGAQAARGSQVTAQTMNGLLRNLETGGYVGREPNPENRRADRWFLTQRGLHHLEKGKGVADEVMRQMLAPLTDKDTERLCSLLSNCTKALHGIDAAKRRAAKPVADRFSAASGS
jgi:MarR family transcriptional regulator for hemolysin